jgi:hypothetical protein
MNNRCSGLQRRVNLQVDINVSEEYTASIFRAKARRPTLTAQIHIKSLFYINMRQRPVCLLI